MNPSHSLPISAVQERILRVLADGQRHNREELRKAVDSEATYQTMRQHIYFLREKLRMVGHDIVCETHMRTTYYRHIIVQRPRLLPDPIESNNQQLTHTG